MLIFEVLLVGDIHWKIHRNDPAKQDLSSLPGCFVINPLLYSKLTLPQPRIQARAVGIAEDLVIVRTSGIVFGTNQSQINAASVPFEFDQAKVIGFSDSPDTIFAVVLAYVERLAVSLRQTSRQVDIPRTLTSAFRTELAELPDLDFPQKITDGKYFLQKYVWDTAITWKHLLAADIEIVSKSTPIHEKLILDAIHAFRDRDYRRALLYAAISIESLAAKKLDEVYSTVTQQQSPPNNLRVISRTQAGSAIVSKDPVYEFLFNKSRFAERLHEVPLYLMGKSLLVENEPLYHKAIKLYRTRNKIAHLGEPPSEERSCFEMNENDAVTAIECAIEIIQWFGEQADFPLPKLGFVRLHPLVETQIT